MNYSGECGRPDGRRAGSEYLNYIILRLFWHKDTVTDAGNYSLTVSNLHRTACLKQHAARSMCTCWQRANAGLCSHAPRASVWASNTARCCCGRSMQSQPHAFRAWIVGEGRGHNRAEKSSTAVTSELCSLMGTFAWIDVGRAVATRMRSNVVLIGHHWHACVVRCN